MREGDERREVYKIEILSSKKCTIADKTHVVDKSILLAVLAKTCALLPLCNCTERAADFLHSLHFTQTASPYTPIETQSAIVASLLSLDL